MSVNSKCKAIQIIGHMKAFYRQRIQESTESSKLVSHRARMSGEFDLRIGFTFNKIGKASNICKAKFQRAVWFKVIWFTSF